MDNNKNDEKAFSILMKSLAEVFDDGKAISALRMELYWRSLEEFSIEEVTRAVSVMIKERVYPSFPKPAEIEKEINGSMDQIATEALIKFEKALEIYGGDVTVQFDDPVIHSVVKLIGGWTKVGLTANDEWQWVQKRFVEYYRQCLKLKNHPKKLIGRSEKDNSKRDLTPIFISDFTEQKKLKPVRELKLIGG